MDVLKSCNDCIDFDICVLGLCETNVLCEWFVPHYTRYKTIKNIEVITDDVKETMVRDEDTVIKVTKGNEQTVYIYKAG
jgi:hypothetical protein